MLNLPSPPDCLHSAAEPSIGKPAQPASTLPDWLEPLLTEAGFDSLLLRPSRLCLLLPETGALQSHLDRSGLTLDDWLADPVSLRAWLLEHLVSADMEDGASWDLLTNLGGRVMTRHPLNPQSFSDAAGRTVRLGRRHRLGYLRVRRISRLLEAPTQGLIAMLAERPELSLATQALKRSGIDTLLLGQGPMTVLAPSNVAFERLAERLGLRLPTLMTDAGLLGDLMRYHLIPGRWLSHELPWGAAVRTVHGAPLHLGLLGTLSDGACTLALLPGSDRQAANGVLHLVGDVLIAPTG